MKKIFILLVCSVFTLNSIFAQTSMQASIGPGSTVTRVKLYLKALRPTQGATTETISTLDFNLGVKESDYVTPPTLTPISNVFGIGWMVETPYKEGGFWNYHIYKSLDIAPTPFVTGMETYVMELELSGGAPIPIITPVNVSLVTLTDGGSFQTAIFYCTGTINSDGSNLYYSRPTELGIATTATNGFSYRPFHINSTLGTDPSTATLVLGPLPVKFAAFDVIKKKNDAILTWQVESEGPLTDRYEIERSLNGVDFKSVYTVEPKNNGRTSNGYDITDFNLSSIRSSSGVIYYRVKQFDKDARYITTPIKSVRLDGRELGVAVFPNPIRSYANVTIDLADDAKVLVTITDAAGKQVESLQWQLFKGANIKKINMSALASGSYLMKVQAGTEVKTIPLAKTN